MSSIAAVPTLAPPGLLARVAEGDHGAMDDLFSTYGRLAYGIALRVVRDPSLAEDAVQDAFLTIWKTAAAYCEDRANESAWIVMLVHRRAVDIVRRSQRRAVELTLDDEHPAEDVAFVDPYEAARIRAALAQLSAAERECLELAYYDGLTQTEVAERIGIPVGTVKSRTMRELSNVYATRSASHKRWLSTSRSTAQEAGPSESRALQALRAGDEEAFVALINRHGPSMIRVACLYVGSRAVAEEVVQETWIDMIGGLERFEERSSLRTWIFVILVNNARKRAEREARSIAVSQLGEELGEPSPEDGLFFSPDHPRWPGAWTTAVRRWDALPDEMLISRETFDVVLQAAEALPSLQRSPDAARRRRPRCSGSSARSSRSRRQTSVFFSTAPAAACASFSSSTWKGTFDVDLRRARRSRVGLPRRKSRPGRDTALRRAHRDLPAVPGVPRADPRDQDTGRQVD